MKKKISLLIVLALTGVAYAAPVNLTTIVREGSSAWLGLTFKDQAGTATTPQSIRYQVSDEATGQNLVDVTNVTPTPGGNQTIDISPCANRILNESKDSENRLVTVIYTYGGSGQNTGTDYARYQVNNIPGFGASRTPPCGMTPLPTATATPTSTPTRTP